MLTNCIRLKKNCKMIIFSRLLRFLKKEVENSFFILRVLKLKCLYPGINIDFKTKIEPNCSISCVKGGSLTIRNSGIGFGTHIKVDSTGSVSISDTFIGRNCVITSKLKITIKSNCLIAEMVVIRDQDHELDTLCLPANQQKFSCAPIELGEHVWLASKATILKGVIIEKGSVVAASAVVTKSIGSHQLWGGIPAKFIKNLEKRDD